MPLRRLLLSNDNLGMVKISTLFNDAAISLFEPWELRSLKVSHLITW